MFIQKKMNFFVNVLLIKHKMDYGITSDEYDDLDIGYEITYTFGVLFIPEIMALDMFDIRD